MNCSPPKGAIFEEAQGNDVALYDVVDLLPRHKWRRYKRRAVEGIDLLILHHSGRLSREHQCFNGMKNSARFVTTQRAVPGAGPAAELGWPGFPYQAWIPYGDVFDHDGRRVWFRGNHDETRSWHTGGLNHRGWSICLQGSLGTVPPSEHQLICLREAVPWACERFGIHRASQVIGHCDAGQYGGHRKRACPGHFVESWLHGLRTELPA